MSKQEIHVGSGSHLNIQTSQLVSLHETLTVVDGSNPPVELNVKIEADLGTVPEQYHEVFLNIMTSKYYSKVSFGDNPFSQCLVSKKKPWWYFWKS